MIPQLPPTVSEEERNQFYATLAGNLSDQSTIHIHWHTHRQNPSVCWICDMNTLLATAFNTKSPLDMETGNSSEDDSDAEIENESLNRDEEHQLEDGEEDEVGSTL